MYKTVKNILLVIAIGRAAEKKKEDKINYMETFV